MLAAAMSLIVWPCVWGAARAQMTCATDKHYSTQWLPVLLLRPRIVAGLAASEGRGRVGIEKAGPVANLKPKWQQDACTGTYKEDQPAPANVSSMTRLWVSNRHTHIRIPPPTHPG